MRKENTYREKGSSRLRSHFLRCCMFWIYLGIVGVLTWFRFYGQCPTQQGLITKTIDFRVIVSVVVIVAPIVRLAMWKAGKEVCTENKDNTASSENEKLKANGGTVLAPKPSPPVPNP